MRVLTIGWDGGYLDEHLFRGSCRIDVEVWANVIPLTSVYFEPPSDWILLKNYLGEVGWREVSRKIRSRLAERPRNVRYVSCGTGRIVEADEAGGLAPGDRVAFVAPVHPAAMERVVLHHHLVTRLPDETSASGSGRLLYSKDRHEAEVQEWSQRVAGWSPFSSPATTSVAGPPVASGPRPAHDDVRPTPLQAAEGAEIVRYCAEAERRGPVQLLSKGDPVQTRRAPTASLRGRRPTAILFGYGNYAKTIVIPNVSDHLEVIGVHEIDPVQVGRHPDRRRAWSTAADHEPDERADTYLIAGYHHCHAALAIGALERGAAAVVEKPIVTTRAQLEELEAAVRRTSCPLFACFQKRYSPFNSMALEDLEVDPGGPISFHCLVYEVPLPERHWYRWMTSGSRLLSNGCHWVDHFLFLNGFPRCTAHSLKLARNGDISVTLDADNGAFFSMVLTDSGSARIGMQNYVELRHHDRTVRIVNDSQYRAEGPRKILRRRHLDRLHGHRRMYREIAARVARKDPGDDVRWNARSCEVVLNLEDACQEALKARRL
jgi:predicted dehydrogenase